MAKLASFFPALTAVEKPEDSGLWYFTGISEGAALATLVPGAAGSGGFGTMDELFEALTLIQTLKIVPFPVVLVGRDFWAPLVDGMKRTLRDEYQTVSRAEDYHDVPGWLARAYPELFSEPRLLDQLELFSLAFDLNELVHFPPPTEQELPPLHAANRIAATLRGRGHLNRWFARVV